MSNHPPRSDSLRALLPDWTSNAWIRVEEVAWHGKCQNISSAVLQRQTITVNIVGMWHHHASQNRFNPGNNSIKSILLLRYIEYTRITNVLWYPKPSGTAPFLNDIYPVSNDVQHPIRTATCYDFGYKTLFSLFTLIVISTRTWTASEWPPMLKELKRPMGNDDDDDDDNAIRRPVLMISFRFTHLLVTQTHKLFDETGESHLMLPYVIPTNFLHGPRVSVWTSALAPGLIFSSDGAEMGKEFRTCSTWWWGCIASHSFTEEILHTLRGVHRRMGRGQNNMRENGGVYYFHVRTSGIELWNGTDGTTDDDPAGIRYSNQTNVGQSQLVGFGASLGWIIFTLF